MTPLIDGKVCNKCKTWLPLTAFSRNKECSLGVVGTCRQCENERVTKWYRDNRKRRQQAMNERNRKRKRLVVEHFGDKCLDCGQTYPQCVYEFHHLDPSQKDWNPSQSLSHSEERMWQELNKCVMLCSKCHKIRHFGLGESEDRNDPVD